MIENKYRLKDYIITEYDNFYYTWEMNVVLGEHLTGLCFIIGDILVLHSSGHKKNGCLKLEYYEKLIRLPVWTKTHYYCFSDSLKDVDTGKSLTNYLNQAKIETEQYRIEKNLLDKKHEYQLSLYKLIIESDGAIFWENHDGLSRINQGPCMIKSAILFLGSKFNKIDETQSKKEWLCKLKSLPKWDRTFAWGHLRVLHDCHSDQETKKAESVVVKLEKIKECITSNETGSGDDKYDNKEKRTIFQLYFHGLRFNSLDWVKDWFNIIKPKQLKLLNLGVIFLKKIFLGIKTLIQSFGSR